MYSCICTYVCVQINLVYPMYSNVIMKSLTDCELFVITREALSEVLYFYPEGKLYMSICVCCMVQARVETGSGHPGYQDHPGHILSGSKYLILHLIIRVDNGI